MWRVLDNERTLALGVLDISNRRSIVRSNLQITLLSTT